MSIRVPRRTLLGRAPPLSDLPTLTTHIANQTSLVRAEGLDPAEIRDLVSYADAYEPLTTYALAQRLAKLPEHAGLKPHVADMRRALERRGRKPTPEERAQKAAERAEKAAERAAKAAAKIPKAAAKIPQAAATSPADTPTPRRKSGVDAIIPSRQ